MLNGGALKNSTVTASGGAKLVVEDNSPNVLDNVTVNGDVDVTRHEVQLRIRNGLVLNGVLHIDNNAFVAFEGTQTFATGTVEFAGDSGGLGLSSDTTLTLGPQVVVHGKSGVIGQTAFLGGTQNLINQGLISADVAGGTLTINPQQFDNTGTIEASAAGSSVIVRVTPFSNHGSIQELNGGKVLINP